MKQLGASIAESLRLLIAPHFLRRDKRTLFGPTGTATQTPTTSETPAAEASSTPSTTSHVVCTTRKNDLVVWLQLSSPQLQLYTAFLGSEVVREALNRTQSPLAALTRLKQICDHPRLLSPAASADAPPQSPGSLAFHKANSAKLEFLAGLLPNLREAGHRVLIFSQSIRMLDIIQTCVKTLECKFIRIDGSITSTAERERRITMFNTDRSIFCFLLTSGVGALGINLTTADRVVICMCFFFLNIMNDISDQIIS